MRTVIGVILVAVGAIGLIWGGITYVKDRDTVDLGFAKVTAEQKDTIPLPPIASGIILAAGTSLLLIGRRRSA
ncbi:MAG: DUF3185 domain-containing protein [Candidatus Eisenbacteria bacterium]|uniref:DUF3185 domain-containing protein n=1 Tax=Eiseniibacteriota bacterium TaxID=2212470 RepID=A0A956LXI6_UNCEI|nr:DUF3185 domain-containing protein [Candidatus Eisenbacteria bacterium]